MSNEYFAALPPDQIGRELYSRCEGFYSFLNSSGYYRRMLKSFRSYYGMSLRGNENTLEISHGGDQDELAYMRVNHYRNIAQHLLNLTTSQRPSPQPIASNSDHKSLSQATLASGLLDYYSREKRVERNLRMAAEQSIIFGEGYVKIEWDTSAGAEEMTDDADVIVRAGDVKFSNLSPLDVLKDPHRENSQDLDWVITRTFVNRFDIAAKYPELAERIIALQTKDQGKQLRLRLASALETTDDVPVYEFYHRKSDALPSGRYVSFLDGDIILHYGDLPYRGIPIRRICPAELIGSPYGYSPMFDLLAVQEAIDALYSVVVTNQTTFGVQNIMVPKGHDLTSTVLAGGLNLIEYDDKLGKPEALNLTYTPQEIFGFIKQLEGVMETLSGVNATVRGNPEASLKSGSALALIQSQAIQFSSGLQASYAQLVEDVYTDCINLLRDYATTPRVAAIIGKNNRYMTREFTGDDFNQINRVVVNSGSAMAQTLSGRMQIAQDLLQNKMITRPEEYLNVVKTGNLDPLLEGDQAELLLVREENELLAEGKAVDAVIVDSHSLHIREHRCVLANPEMRKNKAIVTAVTSHMQQHIELLRTGDPALLAMLGEQSIAQPPQPGQPQGGANPNGSQPVPPGPSGSSVAPKMPNLEQAVPHPQYPVNPATGEQWNPLDGGGMLPAL